MLVYDVEQWRLIETLHIRLRGIRHMRITKGTQKFFDSLNINCINFALHEENPQIFKKDRKI